MQIQQRQHLADLRAARHHAGKIAEANRFRSPVSHRPLVVDPRRMHIHRARRRQHLPRLGPAVAHHQPVAILVPLAGERVDVGITSAPNAAASIRRAPSRTISSISDPEPPPNLSGRTLLHYLEHGRTFPADVPAPACLRT